MNIEIIQICNFCGQSMNELNLIVETDLNIIWSDRDRRYIIQSGSFDFQQLDYLFCPQCYRESKATKQNKKIVHRKNIDNSNVCKINNDNNYIIQFLRTALNELLVVFKRKSK